MFNTPILDVAIGLVFVFLLYSLLATSINEAIATGLSLRARMLRKAIVEKMLSNVEDENKWLNVLKGIGGFFSEIIYTFTGSYQKKGSQRNIGDQFYAHPMIKNYGSNSFFKIPSYLAASNFTIVIIETLKEDFNNKISEIALQKVTDNKTFQQAIDELNNSSDIIKIKELMDYYTSYYAANPGTNIFNGLPGLPRGLDKEVHCILQMHLHNSLYDFDNFVKKIEGWYNDTMDRVSGWYKRQTQFILFVLGLALAFIFNVDTIDISNKLSTDKDAREQTVQLAIQASDLYKNDPRVQRQTAVDADTAAQLLQQAQQHLNEAKHTLDSSIENPNQILGLGWGKFGADDTAFIRNLSTANFHRFIFIGVIPLNPSFLHIQDSVNSFLKNSNSAYKDSVTLAQFYKQQVKIYPARVKLSYISHLLGSRKLLGFLLTAFAICLGAPFWFDMLNKLVSIRGAGKKGDASNEVELSANKGSATTIINTGTQNASTEAVG